MNASSKDVANNLLEIIKELEDNQYLVNPFLRISKATPEQMQKYSVVNSKFPRVNVLIYLLITMLITIIKVPIFILASILLSYQYRIYNTKFSKGKVLFISHGIGENITKKYEDQFFAQMPEVIKSKNKECVILYTNHNLIGYRTNSKLLASKEGGIERHLIPKFLKPNENAKYLSKVISLSSKTLYYGLRKLFSDPVKSILLLKSSAYFYNRATYSNYLLAKRVQEFCSKSKVDTLVLTFEGHSYEQYLIETVKKRQSYLSIVMYQHSPIVSDQFGVKQFLKTNNISLSILTTGIFYKNMFSNISIIPRYIVIGSSKSNLNFIRKNTGLTSNVLFAPEGTSLATVSFLKLAKYLCLNTQNIMFYMRLHPNYRPSILVIYLIKNLSRKSNFLLSNKSLHEDLKIANFVFYRGSAVAVESLKSRALPVFYGEIDGLGLNVLGNLSIKLPIAVSHKEALMSLQTPNKNISKLDRAKIFNELFSKLDYKKLNKVMKI